MTTPAPDTGRTAEEMREFRKALALACNDPGHFVGYKGERSLGEWQVDALLSGPLAPILQEAATARKERDEARAEADGLRQMIRALAEVQKSAREAEERHAQWQWDHPIVRGASTTAAEAEAAHLRAENANLRDRVREAEGAGRDPDGSEPLPAVEPLRVSPASAAAVSRAAKRSRAIEIMNDYADAYMAANKKSPDFRLLYANGWVLFQSIHSHCTLDKRRLSHIVGMTERLRARANDERAQRENAKRSSPKDASVVGEAEAPTPLPDSRSENAGGRGE